MRTDVRYLDWVRPGMSAARPNKDRRAASQPSRQRRVGRSGRLAKTDLAWLAGFLDGEGTIFVVREKRAKGRVVLKGRMSVDNTDLSNIRRARRLTLSLTGHRAPMQITNVSRGYRPCHSLRFNRARDVAVILLAVMPWLVGKRARARLMLRFIGIAPRSELSGRSRERRRTQDSGRWAKCYAARSFAIAEEIRRLNRRYGRGEWECERVAKVIRSSRRPSARR